MKALIVWGGWEGHESTPCADVFAPLLAEEGFEAVASDFDAPEAREIQRCGLLWAAR